MFLYVVKLACFNTVTIVAKLFFLPNAKWNTKALCLHVLLTFTELEKSLYL